MPFKFLMPSHQTYTHSRKNKKTFTHSGHSSGVSVYVCEKFDTAVRVYVYATCFIIKCPQGGESPFELCLKIQYVGQCRIACIVSSSRQENNCNTCILQSTPGMSMHVFHFFFRNNGTCIMYSASDHTNVTCG